MDAKVNFRISEEWLKDIDEAAAADHRDRTSMMHKIIAFYFENNPPANGTKRSVTPRKKAGIR